MIPLSSLVTSLEISKKLKEMGVRQDTQFIWFAFEDPTRHLFKESDFPDDSWMLGYAKQERHHHAHDFEISAFTAGELGMILPHYVYTEQNDPLREWFCFCDSSDYFLDFDLDIFVEKTKAVSEADSRGLGLIYLLENKLITLESVNAQIER